MDDGQRATIAYEIKALGRLRHRYGTLTDAEYDAQLAALLDEIEQAARADAVLKMGQWQTAALLARCAALEAQVRADHAQNGACCACCPYCDIDHAFPQHTAWPCAVLTTLGCAATENGGTDGGA